jgi:hypothetical protein
VIAAREAAEAERTKIGEAGKWETVVVYEEATESNEEGDIALATAVIPQFEEEDVRSFAFDAPAEAGPSTKKRIRDVYDDEGFDPDELLKKARFKQETKRQEEERAAREREEKKLDRSKWQGITLGPDGKPVVKPEDASKPGTGTDSSAGPTSTIEATPTETATVADDEVKPKVEANSMFKKRRPVNANRSTRQK